MGARTPINLPALSTTIGAMAMALEKLGGKAAVDLIDWALNPTIADIVTSWPAVIDATRAKALGLEPDPDFESIVAEYIRKTCAWLKQLNSNNVLHLSSGLAAETQITTSNQRQYKTL